MTTQHIETLVIGAGQAGLATAYHLTRRGRQCLVVDGNDRIGDNWRSHWDTLKLYSPARYDGLPGLAFPGDPHHYPGRDEVADFLERYAVHFDLPVRMRTRIERLERAGDGYRATMGDDSIACDNVVVATGTFGRTPSVPAFAADLDPRIQQLHSSEYKRPGQIAPGTVLVVGAAHSGMDVAFELGATHSTILCGRDCGEIPFRIESRRARAVFPGLVFLANHVLTRRTPIGRKMMPEIRHHGGPGLRVKRADLAGRHVERTTERVVGIRDGRPLLADGRVVDADAVVWCTGFRQDFSWIDLPIVGEDGWPEEYRGVVEKAPGMFFCGLAFQYSFSSTVLPGVGRDAAYVADKVAARAAALRRRTAVAA